MRRRANALGVLVAMAALAGPARAVDTTGTWSICLEFVSGALCAGNDFAATLTSASDQFTMDLTLSDPDASLPCVITGTVDPGTGALTPSLLGCIFATGFAGTATDTSITGTIDFLTCSYTFAAVRECGACDDGDACTTNGCGTTACSAPSSTCTFGTTVGAPCDDGTVCTQPDTCRLDLAGARYCGGPPVACPTCTSCDPVEGCQPDVAPLCLESTNPPSTLLLLRTDPDPANDKLVWKWGAGAATDPADLGDPTVPTFSGTTYELCVFEDATAAPAVVLGAAVAAGLTCPADSPKPCWVAKGNPPGAAGYAYRAVAPYPPNGVQKIRLKPGVAGKAKMTVKGKEVHLALPANLALVEPVLVQLRNSAGVCWEASYTQPLVERADFYKAKGTP